MKTIFPLEKLSHRETPFYFYDMDLLRETLAEIKRQTPEENFHVHYAIKANATNEVMKEIFRAGLGADCVSGGEVRAALEHGVPAEKIVFAGVAKADWEIRYALENDIFCFNVESPEELEVINQIAEEMSKIAKICIRINPNIDAHTHKNITTGKEDNKFGVAMADMLSVVKHAVNLSHIRFLGLHFHIGSQITDFAPFRNLVVRVNELVAKVEAAGIPVENINVGGGLGCSYEHPNHYPMPDFEGYFRVFRRALNLRSDQTLHFELGRAVVAQCGNLITHVLFVKKAPAKQFVMCDAGMTDLIRPALYQAFHQIENLTARQSNRQDTEQIYDVVGPICESSDVFVEHFAMPETQRGDMLAIRSAGAYGEIMASQYNLRRLPGHITSDEIK